jgi:hypothetical protein
MFRPRIISLKPNLINNTINDYCKNSINQNTKNIIEKYKSKKYTTKIKYQEDDNFNYKPDNKIYIFLFLLSISSISFYFYKRIKE